MWTGAGPDDTPARFLEAARVARVFVAPTLLLTLLYAIVWLVCWRGRPARAPKFRGAWLLLLALLWGFTGLLGARMSWIVGNHLPAFELPAALRPLVTATLALLFFTLGVLRLRRAAAPELDPNQAGSR